MKYTYKKLEVEAIKFNGENFKEIESFSHGNAVRRITFDRNEEVLTVFLNVNTIEGVVIAKKGDYIVKENGKYKPMTKKVFKSIYTKIPIH